MLSENIRKLVHDSQGDATVFAVKQSFDGRVDIVVDSGAAVSAMPLDVAANEPMRLSAELVQ